MGQTPDEDSDTDTDLDRLIVTQPEVNGRAGDALDTPEMAEEDVWEKNCPFNSHPRSRLASLALLFAAISAVVVSAIRAGVIYRGGASASAKLKLDAADQGVDLEAWDGLTWRRVCSDRRVSTIVGREECAHRCAEYSDCCDGVEEEGGSSDGNQVESVCDLYRELCPKLAADVEAWEEDCSDRSVVTRKGHDLCDGRCRDHECCIDDDMGCDEINSVLCEVYWSLCPKLADNRQRRIELGQTEVVGGDAH